MASKLDAGLRKRIRYAAFNRQPGDETLGNIAEEYGISTHSMYNHAKKHISPVETETHKEVKVAKKTIEIQAQVQKDLELQLSRETVDEIDARPIEIVGVDELIAQGIQKIKEGKMQLTTTTFLGAVKLKTDWSAKQQTNKIELMRTITNFRSGKNKQIIEGEIDEPTDGPTGCIDTGEDEPNLIFRKTFGHAPTQGSEEVPSGHDETQEED
jgi:hypothetical protein